MRGLLIAASFIFGICVCPTHQVSAATFNDKGEPTCKLIIATSGELAEDLKNSGSLVAKSDLVILSQGVITDSTIAVIEGRLQAFLDTCKNMSNRNFMMVTTYDVARTLNNDGTLLLNANTIVLSSQLLTENVQQMFATFLASFLSTPTQSS